MLRRSFIATVSKRACYSTATVNTATTAAAAPTPTAVIKPVKKVGAFRGGFLGFFAGVSVTSAVVYYYVLDEYKNSNNLIIKDVLSLTKSIRVLEEHVKALENNQVAKK